MQYRIVEIRSLLVLGACTNIYLIIVIMTLSIPPQVQLISCAGDAAVFVWSLARPDSDEEDEMMDEHMFEQTKGGGALG